MAYTRITAKKLLTVAELDIFDASKPVELKKLTKPQLRSLLERARKLRDKYRDLYRRQRLALRAEVGSKSGTKGGDANERTRQKEELLAEVVLKLEERMAVIEKAEDQAFAKLGA